MVSDRPERQVPATKAGWRTFEASVPGSENYQLTQFRRSAGNVGSRRSRSFARLKLPSSKLPGVVRQWAVEDEDSHFLPGLYIT